MKGEDSECSFSGLALLQHSVQLVHRHAVQSQVVVGVAQLVVTARKHIVATERYLSDQTGLVQTYLADITFRVKLSSWLYVNNNTNNK